LDPHTEQLRKILELEQAKGYGNLAVIGGLDRYLHGCLEKTEATEQAFFLKEVCSPGFSYAALSENERKEWVERILQQLAKVDVASKQPTGVPSPAKGSLDSPITILRGISSALAAKFARLGVKTVKDMLYFFPRRHLNYSQRVPISELEKDQEQTIIATVWEAHIAALGWRKSTEATVADDTGTVRVVWFNQPYLAKRLRTNTQIVLSGKANEFPSGSGKLVFESPEWEPLESEDLIHTGRLVPLYPLTEGLNPRRVRKLVKEVVAQWSPQLVDFLPQEVRDHRSLVDLPQAIQQAHYPDSEQMKDEVRRRLAFDELFLIQLGVLARKREWQEGQRGNPFQIDHPLLERFLSSLPFNLTPAQQKVLREILSDLEKSQPMCRLLQGEVGSGKTVVATAVLLVAVANGHQGALMAPTEIL